MFLVSSQQIHLEVLRKALANPEAGALVIFEGWVRNHNEGHDVIALEYECFENLAFKEGEKILEEAHKHFEILDAGCIHRSGRLGIGEIAVWVGVTARHRGPAFKACEFIINEVKVRAPIWKKEFYSNGDSGWVNCAGCSGHTHFESSSSSSLSHA